MKKRFLRQNIWKKQICILLAVAMSAAVFSACEKEAAVPEEPESTQTTVQDSTQSAVPDSTQPAAEEEKGITFPLEETVSFTSFSVATNQYELKDNLAFLYAQ